MPRCEAVSTLHQPKSTLSCIGNFEGNVDLSHIHLAVPAVYIKGHFGHEVLDRQVSLLSTPLPKLLHVSKNDDEKFCFLK